MRLLKNKYILSVALLVTAFFVSVSVGGEFLHKQIHHHTAQAEHDSCPLYQLTLQPVIWAAVAVVVLLIFPQVASLVLPQRPVLKRFHSFSSPRAPPLL